MFSLCYMYSTDCSDWCMTTLVSCQHWFEMLPSPHQKFLTIKPTRCSDFSNCFWSETLHVSDSSSVHHQEFFTVHTAMICVIQVCRQLASKLSANLFHSKNKFEKLVYLVGFIIRNLSRCTVTWTSKSYHKF